MDNSKPILDALAGKVVSPPPVWLMRQAGRYLPEYRAIRGRANGFLELCYSPDLAVEVTLQPLRRYQMDAAILFSDILVIPHALGQSVDFIENEGPVLEPVRDAAAIEKLSLGELHGHLAPVYETVARLSREIPAECTLIGFCGAPWTVATYMVEGGTSRDHAQVRSLALGHPTLFSALMGLLEDASSAYLIEQINHGAEAVQIFDTWAGALSESEFHRWVIAPTRRIIERIKKVHPRTPVIGFPRGAGVLYEDFVRDTGVDAVSLDSSVPLEWAATRLQPHCTVQGNLDNQALVVGGEVLDREARRIIDVLGAGPFIFNLGHGIVPNTPPENVERLIELVRGGASAADAAN